MVRRLLFAPALLTALSLPASAGDGNWHAEPARGTHAMVVSEQQYATRAGVDVLKSGGNAVDAAVAVAYALAVVDMCCGNIGGGGFMLVRMHDGHESFIDFRERAPLRATPAMYQDANGNVVPGASTYGFRAAGVPGTVAGLERARIEFGTMDLPALIAPAISLARNGYPIAAGDVEAFNHGGGKTMSPPEFFGKTANVRAIFMRNGRLPAAGDVLKQPQLAATLKLISDGGAPAFYQGSIARDVVAASDAAGGILSLNDFASYKVEERAPVHCPYHGYDVTSAPPPSSGGVTLCEILGVVAPYDFHTWGWGSVSSEHFTAEAERRAYADRNAYLEDPDFGANPVAQLLDPAYAQTLRASIDPIRATASADVHPGLGAVSGAANPPGHEGSQTTHFSVVDEAGNAVAVTYTINNWFGSGVIAGSTGFFLNDEMDDFTSKPGVPNLFGLVQGVRNEIQPGKRPLSSMTPTIVTRGGKLFMVTGSPGGSRIIMITLATLQNVIDYGMNVQDAVNAPRAYMQWLPDEISYEPDALTADAVRSLAAAGYHTREVPPWGSAQAIVVDPVSGDRLGGSDRRVTTGLALGY